MYWTLIDGKVLKTVTGTKSAQTCPICKATPKEFNNLANIKKETGIFIPDQNALHYGISPLHAWIWSYECCLHIAYRITIEKWRDQTPKDKKILTDQKAEILKLLREKLGLIVDKPKAGGAGTTKDGNSARTAFQNADIFADC